MKETKSKKITPEMLGYVSGSAMQTMDDMFEGQLESDPNKHLKELLNLEGDIRGKTELSGKQIRALIKIRYLAKILGDKDNPDPVLTAICDELMALNVSKDRKSRGEFVEGIKGMNPYQQRQGMFDKIGGWFR